MGLEVRWKSSRAQCTKFAVLGLTDESHDLCVCVCWCFPAARCHRNQDKYMNVAVPLQKFLQIPLKWSLLVKSLNFLQWRQNELLLVGILIPGIGWSLLPLGHVGHVGQASRTTSQTRGAVWSA